MKRYLYGLFALLLTATVVQAGMNLRQNADGTADWVNTHQAASSVGAVYLSALIADISTASTTHFVSPITDAVIEDVQLVMYGQVTTANAEILVTVQGPNILLAGVTNVKMVSVRSPLTSTILLPATFIIPSLNTTGAVFSVSPIFMVRTTGFSNERCCNNATRISIEKGTVINVATDGASTGVIGALVIITLRPRG